MHTMPDFASHFIICILHCFFDDSWLTHSWLVTLQMRASVLDWTSDQCRDLFCQCWKALDVYLSLQFFVLISVTSQALILLLLFVALILLFFSLFYFCLCSLPFFYFICPLLSSRCIRGCFIYSIRMQRGLGCACLTQKSISAQPVEPNKAPCSSQHPCALTKPIALISPLLPSLLGRHFVLTLPQLLSITVYK